MKTLSLAHVFNVLSRAAAVRVDGQLASMSFAPLEGQPDNEFLRLAWDDADEGVEFVAKFTEGENATVRVSGSDLHLVDSEGDDAVITVLMPADLEAMATDTAADPDSKNRRIVEVRAQIDRLNAELAKLTEGLSCDLDGKCRALIATGNRIGAVKLYRTTLGTNLRDAVDYVNRLSPPSYQIGEE